MFKDQIISRRKILEINAIGAIILITDTMALTMLAGTFHQGRWVGRCVGVCVCVYMRACRRTCFLFITMLK